ncbi:MAG: hypothetical protein EBX41_04380 [Chitinophagia bacterium]|nr:hypothetical protein [Chitinophagia bacterium]
MLTMPLKKILFFVFLLPIAVHAQSLQAFKEAQLSASRVQEAWKKYNDVLAKDFKINKLTYPPQSVYIRAFKAQNELEIWVKEPYQTTYQLYKLYHVCALSGLLGPKRKEGDKQVPEGYYYIDEFNPQSEYHLSMRISYPNYIDSLTGKKNALGGNIYIHGGCVTVGCLPMTNDTIEEIYILVLNAKLNGQENIPIHIFPTRLNKGGWHFLVKEYANHLDYQAFWMSLKPGYDYFEKHHKILPTMYSEDGKYVN